MKLELLEYKPVKDSEYPPLLFVHGGYHGAWCWKEHFLPYFSEKGFHVYALSFRGHGASEGREQLNSYSLDDYRDDVLKVLEQLDKKPVLIGHSIGGAVVQKVLHLHPEKIQAVVLMSSLPPYGFIPDFLRIVLFHNQDANRLYLYDQGKSTEFPIKLFLSQEFPTGHLPDFINLIQPESAKARGEFFHRVVPRPEKRTVPMLVIGSKKDRVISACSTKRVAKIYQTEPVIFSNLCHDMMLDPNWRTVADWIITFLYPFQFQCEEE